MHCAFVESPLFCGAEGLGATPRPLYNLSVFDNLEYPE